MHELVKNIEDAVLQAVGIPPHIGNSGIICEAEKTYTVRGIQGRLKSMLEPYELALLYVLARYYYTGQGYIIDAGCLFGASTQVLSAGVRHNSNRTIVDHPIQSFDLFEVNPPYDSFAKGFHVFGPTSNALHTFLKFNSQNLDLVSPHQGDFRRWEWNSEQPIEIIFNDLSKPVELNNKMFRDFISALKPGGFLIQQGYVHFEEWWISASMEYFREDYEELGYYFGSTKLFRKKSSTSISSDKFNVNDLSFQTMEKLLTSAMERAPETVSEALRTALGMFYVDKGKFDMALQTVMPMNLRAERMEYLLNLDIPAHRNFARVLPSYRRRVIEYANNQQKTPA